MPECQHVQMAGLLIDLYSFFCWHPDHVVFTLTAGTVIHKIFTKSIISKEYTDISMLLNLYLQDLSINEAQNITAYTAFNQSYYLCFVY